MGNKVGGVAIPTHFYAVVVRCTDSGVEPTNCDSDKLDAVGMLFQHPTEPGVRKEMVWFYSIILCLSSFFVVVPPGSLSPIQVAEVFSDSDQRY